MDIQEISNLAYKFRRALDEAFRCGAFGRNYPFCNFPCECCDDVCDLFGQLLFDQGINVFRVFGQYRYDNGDFPYPHTWLQLEDGTVIDLTGDQYRNDPIMLHYNIPCYVGKPNQLHRLFQNETKYEPFYGINNYPETATTRLWELYDIVMGFFTRE